MHFLSVLHFGTTFLIHSSGTAKFTSTTAIGLRSPRIPDFLYFYHVYSPNQHDVQIARDHISAILIYWFVIKYMGYILYFIRILTIIAQRV